MITRRVATLLYGTVLLAVGIGTSAVASDARPREAIVTAHSAYEILPLMFEARGDDRGAPATLVSHGHAQRIAVTRDAVHVAVPVVRRGDRVDAGPVDGRAADSRTDAHADVVTMRFAGAREDAHVRGLDVQPGRINYLRAGDPSGNRIDVPVFARAAIEGVYPRIDAIVYGSGRSLEYDLVVAPGGNPEAIRMRVDGASAVTLDDSGNAVITTAGSALSLHRPFAWQDDPGGRRRVDAAFILRDSRELAFAVGNYDRTLPLVIDPVIAYATFVGGSGVDVATAIAVDANGSAYIAGYTASPDFPLRNALDASLNGRKGDMDAFVAKLAPDGKSLVYATYLGGPTGRDCATGIAVDESGSAYVTGTTTAGDFPVTTNAYQNGTATGGSFVAKLNRAGNGLVYSTYVTGATVHSLAVDASGSAYITGKAASTFITTPNAFQPSTPVPGSETGFVLKLAPTGSTASYATFLGGTSSGQATAIAVDAQGRAHVGGWAAGNFPLVLPLQSALAGVKDGFVSVLDATGSRLVSSTVIGGSQSDTVNALALGTDGAVYIAGETYSADFPSVNGFQPVKAGYRLINGIVGNAFVAKLDLSASRIVWSSFLGGEICKSYCQSLIDGDLFPGDAAYGLAVDAEGHAYVSGIARTWTFPLVDSTSPRKQQDNEDSGFVAKVSAAGSAILFSTFVRTGFSGTGVTGGFPEGALNAVAVDRAGAAYVAGDSTFSTQVTTSEGAFQTVNPGGATAIVAKFPPQSRRLTIDVADHDADAVSLVTITARVDGPETSGYVLFKSGANNLGAAPLDANHATYIAPLSPGIHTLNAELSTPDGNVDAPPMILVVDQPLVCSK
ncbi:MAG TPA: SBBP repeat-containing protein [Casimicrobiaceae bacterium]